MRKVLFVLSVMTVCITVIVSCSKSSQGNSGGGISNLDCTNVPKTFATDANPIIQSFCNQPGCHNAGSTNGVGPLTNYAEIFNARVNIRAAVAAGIMPQNATLSTAQKSIILCWIDNGAPNN